MQSLKEEITKEKSRAVQYTTSIDQLQLSLKESLTKHQASLDHAMQFKEKLAAFQKRHQALRKEVESKGTMVENLKTKIKDIDQLMKD